MTERRRRNEIRLDPDPVIKAYKRDVNQTLLRENLNFSVDECFRKLMALQRFAEELRRCGPCRAMIDVEGLLKALRDGGVEGILVGRGGGYRPRLGPSDRRC